MDTIKTYQNRGRAWSAQTRRIRFTGFCLIIACAALAPFMLAYGLFLCRYAYAYEGESNGPIISALAACFICPWYAIAVALMRGL